MRASSQTTRGNTPSYIVGRERLCLVEIPQTERSFEDVVLEIDEYVDCPHVPATELEGDSPPEEVCRCEIAFCTDFFVHGNSFPREIRHNDVRRLEIFHCLKRSAGLRVGFLYSLEVIVVDLLRVILKLYETAEEDDFRR